MTPLFQIVAMCYRLPPGGSPGDGGRPHQEVSNARGRRGKTSGRVEISAEEVRVQNMTEGANIPFTSEINFCLKCHILPQEEETNVSTAMPN